MKVLANLVAVSSRHYFLNEQHWSFSTISSTLDDETQACSLGDADQLNDTVTVGGDSKHTSATDNLWTSEETVELQGMMIVIVELSRTSTSLCLAQESCRRRSVSPEGLCWHVDGVGGVAGVWGCVAVGGDALFGTEELGALRPGGGRGRGCVGQLPWMEMRRRRGEDGGTVVTKGRTGSERSKQTGV